MKQEEIVELFIKMGALPKDSKNSSSFESARLIEDPIVTNRIAVELLQMLPDGTKFDAVLCLHNDEMLFGYSVATAAWARFVTAKVEEGKAVFQKGGSVKKKEKVLIVDDVLDDKQAIQVLIDTVEKQEGKVVGICSVVNSCEKDSFSTDVFTLMDE